MDKASLHPAASRWIELWNGKQALGWDLHGTPVFRFRWAPAGSPPAASSGRCGCVPGGQEPYALLVWRSGQRWAWLYRLDLARPSRVAVTGPAQRARQGHGSPPYLRALPAGQPTTASRPLTAAATTASTPPATRTAA